MSKPVMKFLHSRPSVKDRQIKGFAGTFGCAGERFQSYDDLVKSLPASGCDLIIADAADLPSPQMINTLSQKAHIVLCSGQSQGQADPAILKSLLTDGNAWISSCKEPFVRDLILRFCILNLRSGNQLSVDSLFGWGAKTLSVSSPGTPLPKSLQKINSWKPILKPFTEMINQVESLCVSHQLSISEVKYSHDGIRTGIKCCLPTKGFNSSPGSILAQELTDGHLNGLIINVRSQDIELCKLYVDTDKKESTQLPETTVFIR